jgi:hypothetical protein
MKLARPIAICLFVTGALLQAPLSAWANPGLTINPLNGTTVTPSTLVSTLVGSGVTFSNVSYTGADAASGTFSGGTGIIGFGNGIVLTSGSATNVTGPNVSDSKTTNNGKPGDPDLDAIVGADQSHDASVLQFDFTPKSTPIFFDFVFASDEYNEYANTQFNDVFAFFVNGTNCAMVPNTSTPVSVNNINGGNPFGTNAQNPQYFINNDPSDTPNANLDTEMDGLTTVLTCQANVNAGVTNHVKLAIADTGDSIIDSAVFLKANSFSTIPPSGVITGSVLKDTNGNGRDDADPALAGAVVRLYRDNGDNTFDPETDQQVGGSFTTGSDGTWTFVNLSPGTYFAAETNPEGYVSTGAIPGTNAAKVTNDLLMVVMPAESSSTGNKFLDAQATSGTQPDFAAGFYDGVNQLTIETVYGSKDRMKSRIVVPAPSGNTPYQAGPVVDQEYSAKDPLYINYCAGTMCDAQVDISTLPMGSQPDDPIGLFLIYKDDAVPGNDVFARGDADSNPNAHLLTNCDTPHVARVGGVPTKCVASISTIRVGGEKMKQVIINIPAGNDPGGGKR